MKDDKYTQCNTCGEQAFINKEDQIECGVCGQKQPPTSLSKPKISLSLKSNHSDNDKSFTDFIEDLSNSSNIDLSKISDPKSGNILIEDSQFNNNPKIDQLKRLFDKAKKQKLNGGVWFQEEDCTHVKNLIEDFSSFEIIHFTTKCLVHITASKYLFSVQFCFSPVFDKFILLAEKFCDDQEFRQNTLRVLENLSQIDELSTRISSFSSQIKHISDKEKDISFNELMKVVKKKRNNSQTENEEQLSNIPIKHNKNANNNKNINENSENKKQILQKFEQPKKSDLIIIEDSEESQSISNNQKRDVLMVNGDKQGNLLDGIKEKLEERGVNGSKEDQNNNEMMDDSDFEKLIEEMVSEPSNAQPEPKNDIISQNIDPFNSNLEEQNMNKDINKNNNKNSLISSPKPLLKSPNRSANSNALLAVSKQLTHTHSELESLKHKFKEKESECIFLHQKIDSLSKEEIETEKTIQSLKNDIKNLKESKETESIQSKKTIEKYAKETIAFQGKNEFLATENAHIKEKERVLRQEFEEQTKAINDLKSEFETLNQKHKKIQIENKNFSFENEKLNKQFLDLKEMATQQLDQAGELFRDQAMELKSIKQKLNDVLSQKESLELNYQDSLTNLNTQTSLKNQYQERVKLLEVDNRKLEQIINNSNEREVGLKSQMEEIENELSSTKQLKQQFMNQLIEKNEEISKFKENIHKMEELKFEQKKQFEGFEELKKENQQLKSRLFDNSEKMTNVLKENQELLQYVDQLLCDRGQ